MKNQMMWAFLIHLSEHMWDDETSPLRGLYLPKGYDENNKPDMQTWDEVIASLPKYGINTLLIDLGDAVKYETHPEISAPDAWSKDFMKKKLDEIRALGIQPIPKLNFSAAHDTWLKQYNRMIATPTYYAVCADLIGEVCELFDYPPLFHLGMDEETEGFQHRFAVTTIRNEQVWWHDLNFFFKECEKHGSRPWIWATFSLTKYPNTFAQNMPKSVVMTLGYYGQFHNDSTTTPEARAKSDQAIARYEFINSLGYDQIPMSSTWNYYRNTLQTLGLAKDRLDPKLVKGFIMATWLHTKKWECHGLIHGAEQLYYARKKHYPETFE